MCPPPFEFVQIQQQLKSNALIAQQYFIMSRCGHTTFLTDFSASIVSSEQPTPQQVYRTPRHSSFLNRFKTNAKNRMNKYHIKDRKQSIVGENSMIKSAMKARSLFKIQQSMNQLKLNITSVVPTNRKYDISKTFYTSRKLYTSVDKPQRTSTRMIQRSMTRMYNTDDFERDTIKTISRKIATSSVIRRAQPKPILYQDFYGDIRASKVEEGIRAQNRYYRDFIWKVAYTNEHLLEVVQKPRVYIGKGNNSKLLRTLMRNRWWWVVQKDETKADFIWTQLKIAYIYQGQKCSEVVRDRSTEVKQTFQLTLRGDPALQLMNADQYANWNTYLKCYLKNQRKLDDNMASRRIVTKDYKPLLLTKVSNHLELSRMIGNKKAMFYLMRQYYRLLQKDYTEHLPLTFHIVQALEDQQYTCFLREYNERRRKEQTNIWIVKPGEMSNRGNGIKVCNTLDQVKSILKSKNRHNNGKVKTYIVQLYMSEPFLYKGRKFDIRHYIMITSVNGLIKGYWYQEGYIRTTSYEFNLGNLNGLVHLTNDAVQKYGKDYGKFERGNKVSYSEFQTYLDVSYGENYYNFEQILDKMKSIATDVMRASFLHIDPKRRQHNFEIFGMDFMISGQFKPYLIQINTNPCLQLSSPLLAKLIPSMVDNALRIGLDPLFPPPAGSNKKLNIPPNRFQLIFDELTEKQGLEKLYQGQKKVEQMLQDIGSDDEAYQDIQEDDS